MNEEAIFAAALDKKTAAERKAYLDQACAGDAELRGQIEELLKADSNAGSFLNQPPLPIDATVDSGETSRADSGAWISRLSFLQPCNTPGRLGKLSGKVGEYEIIEIVGHGGMGAVLRAFDTKLSRVVAVKVMAPELAANPVAVRRFLREATTAAAVHHDHVVTIHAVDDSHQPPYLVMQFVEGQTLQEKIDGEGPLELKQILRIGSQAAAGLAAAHKTGLIHRDVKPSNILLENGVQRVKISDFGLARAADDLQVTQTGIIAGTPQYMSPEQAKGEPIDARSDLFSLGSVLYTMCTGRSAFRADNPIAVLRRVCDDTPRRIHELNPDIPSWLEAIVSKLLAKTPADRFQTAAEVAELLGQHLAHVQNPALAPLPPAVAPAAVQNESLSPAVGLQPRFTTPPPLWLWGVGAICGFVVMVACLIYAAVGLNGRIMATTLLAAIFLWMGSLAWVAIFHPVLRQMQWNRAQTRSALPRKPSARGMFIEHPVLGVLAVFMLIASASVATYMLTDATFHKRMNELASTFTAASKPEIRELPKRMPGTSSEFSAAVTKADLANWGKFIDPRSDCRLERTMDSVTITVPGGPPHNLLPMAGYNHDAPRLIQEIEGDFTIQVTVTPYELSKSGTSARRNGVSYRSAGLLVWADGDNFLRFERSSFGERGDGAPFLHLEWYVDGRQGGDEFDSVPDVADGSSHLRIESRGGELQLSISNDGQSWTQWKTVRRMNLSPKLSVGVFAQNSTTGDLSVSFEHLSILSDATSSNIGDQGAKR